MKTKTFLLKLIKNKIFIGVAILLVGGGLYFAFKGGSASADVVKIQKTDFTKTVSVSGKVIASEDVDLAFETSGTVAQVYKKVGDGVYAGEVIAALDSSDIKASRDKAEADLESAQAKLATIKSGGSISSETDINKDQLVNSIVEGYTKADDAVRNKVDQYFRDPRSTNPKIKYTYQDYLNTQNALNDARASVERDLVNFQVLVAGLSASTYSENSLSSAKGYLLKVKSFLEMLSPAVNTFETETGLTQTTIDKYKTDLSTARFNINESISNLSTSEDRLRGSLSDVSVQEANVKAAAAVVRNFDAQIAKTVIIAPFSGVVSVQNAKVGESVGSNVTTTSLISKGLQVEAYIPEISIPGIVLQNKAKVTLDAYPDISFDAVIVHIDPAETLKDGVSNYKVKLAFVSSDPRIRSGLSGDVSIDTERREGVISIPLRAIVSETNKDYVYKKTSDASIKTEVTLGSKDGKGNVEVLTGIMEGDEILLNPTK